MNLYIKQRVFSLADKYDIYDAAGNLVYDVKGKLFAFLPKFSLCDLGGQELFRIQRRFRFFTGAYELFCGETLYATLEQELTLFSPRLHVRCPFGEIEVQGSPFGMEFEICQGGFLLGSVHKKWLSWGDSYEMEIVRQQDAAFFCALVIAIDNCVHNENHNA